MKNEKGRMKNCFANTVTVQSENTLSVFQVFSRILHYSFFILPLGCIQAGTA
jgi:hypothetical protein